MKIDYKDPEWFNSPRADALMTRKVTANMPGIWWIAVVILSSIVGGMLGILIQHAALWPIATKATVQFALLMIPISGFGLFPRYLYRQMILARYPDDLVWSE